MDIQDGGQETVPTTIPPGSLITLLFKEHLLNFHSMQGPGQWLQRRLCFQPSLAQDSGPATVSSHNTLQQARWAPAKQMEGPFLIE